MINKSNNFLQDSVGDYSMARLAVLVSVVMSVYCGVCIPFFPDTASTLMNSSLAYMGIATASKSISKLTERK